MKPKKIFIGNYELICLIISLICTKMYLSFARNITVIAGTAAWILAIYITGIVILFFTIYQKIYPFFKNLTIIEVAEKGFGKTGKYIFGLLFFVSIFYVNAITLRTFCEDVKIISLINTPISIVLIVFIVCMIIGAYYGIEALARVSGILVPLIAVAYIFILVNSSSKFDISGIFPILGNGPKKIFFEGFPQITNYAEIIFLLYLPKYIKQSKDFKIIGYTSLSLSGICFITGTLCFLLTFKYPSSIEYFLPIYQISRFISISTFLSRLESVFVIFWGAVAIIYLSSSLFLLTDMFTNIFLIKDRKPLIFPFSILFFAISMLSENAFTSFELETKNFIKYGWIVFLVLPAFIYIYSYFRLKQKGEIKIEKKD